MTINQARLIRELKRRCTYRRLAEIYYPEGHDSYGVQEAGDDLCLEAFKVLYPGLPHPFEIQLGTYGESFDSQNKSHIGEFYWWE